MKSTNLLSTAAAAGLILFPARILSQNDDPFAPDAGAPDRESTREELYESLPKLIQVQVEWIELDHKTLTGLLFLRDLKGDSTGLRKEVQHLVDEDKARIVETAIAITRSGQKASSESVQEKIYPTEYEPAEIPNEVQINADTTAETLAQLVTPPTPTAFETRFVGTTVEVEPVVGADGKTVEVRFSPEIVIDTGNVKWQTLKDSVGNENHITMPLFFSMRTSTGLTVRAGQYRLAGVQSVNGEDGEVDRSRKMMIFLKADVLAIGEEDLPAVEPATKAVE